jgi:hypothetical protein
MSKNYAFTFKQKNLKPTLTPNLMNNWNITVTATLSNCFFAVGRMLYCSLLLSCIYDISIRFKSFHPVILYDQLISLVKIHL